MLFTISKGFSVEQASIAVLSLETGTWKTLVENATAPHFVQPGILVFARQGILWAAPFDLSQLKVSGAPTPVLEGVMASTSFGTEQFSLSDDGELAFIAGASVEPERQIVGLDRKGEARTLTTEKRAYEDLSLSPDGHHLAMTVEGPEWNIWTFDLGRGVLARLTLVGDNRDPFWTPNGKQIVYTSFRNGMYGLYEKAADGSGSEQELYHSKNWVCAESFSPGGQYLAFEENSPSTRTDIWILPLHGEPKPRPFVQTAYTEWSPAFSPDGHWIAYESDESGRSQIYIQPFPGPGGRWQISNEDGTRPFWNHDGRELYYINEKKVMVVPIQGGASFSAGTPRVLFEGDFFASGHFYDISPNGQQFFFIKDVTPAGAPTEVNVILNWSSEIKRLLSGSDH